MISGFIQYVGSKAKLSERIINLMPKHNSYIEPFFGSGAVFFNKEQVRHELINDASNDLYTFLLYLKYHKKELISEIETYAYNEALFNDVVDKKIQIPTELHKVAMWYVMRAILYRGTTSGFGMITTPNNAIEIQRISQASEYLEYYANRVKNACISNKDVFKILESDIDKGTMVYLDPPYLFDDNRITKYYNKESSNFAQVKTHARLKNMIDELTEKGVYVICSYQKNSYINDMYVKDNRYNIIEIDYASTLTEKRNEYKEQLILNYTPRTYGKNKTFVEYQDEDLNNHK